MSLIIYDGRFLAADRTAHEDQGITYDICKLAVRRFNDEDPDPDLLARMVGGVGGVPHCFAAMDQVLRGVTPDVDLMHEPDGEWRCRILRIEVRKRHNAAGSIEIVGSEPSALGADFPHRIKGLKDSMVIGLESCIVAARVLLAQGLNAMQTIHAISEHNPTISSTVDYFDTLDLSFPEPKRWLG